MRAETFFRSWRRTKVLALFSAVPMLMGAAWTPGTLEKAIVDRILLKVSQTTPYEIRAEKVSGDFIHHISLNGLHMTSHGSDAQLLQANSLEISVKWTGLLHHRLEIRELKLVAPSLFITLDEEGKLVWPKGSPTPSEDSSFAFYIERLDIVQGRVLVKNEATDPDRALTLAPIELAASLSPASIVIEQLSLALSGGTAVVKGQIDRKNNQRATLDIRTRDFPLHKLMGIVFTPPEPLRLVHTGHWTVAGTGQQWKVRTQGTLEGAGFIATANTRQDGSYVTHVALRPLPLKRVWRDPDAGQLGAFSATLEASASSLSSTSPDVSGTWRIVQPSSGSIQAPVAQGDIHLIRGRGLIIASGLAEGLQAQATAQINLPEKNIKGLFQMTLKNFLGASEWIPALRDAEGHVMAKGTVEGHFPDVVLNTEAQADHLRMGHRTVEETHITLVAGLGKSHPLKVAGKAKTIVLDNTAESPWDISNVEFQVDGKAPLWQTNTTAVFRNQLTFNYAGFIRQELRDFRFAWTTLALTPKKGAALHSTHAGEAIQSRTGTWTIENLELSNGQGFIRIPKSTFKKGIADLDFFITDMRLESLTSVLWPDRKIIGLLNADVQLDGPWRTPHGTVNVRISTGSVSDWAFNEFDLKARLQRPWIFVDQLDLLTPKAANSVHGKGQLPMHLLNGEEPDQPIAFHLEAPDLDTNLLTAAIPGLVVEKGGAASIKLDVTGHYSEPDIKGQITAHFPRLTYKDAGLDVRDFNADLRSQGKTLEVHEFSGKTKKGEFHGGGQSTWPKLNFTLKGTDLQLHIRKQLDAKFDIDLLLGGELKAPELTGELGLKSATYFDDKKKKDKPKKAETGTDDSSGNDATTSSAPTLWESLMVNVHAFWTRNVWYRAGLSKIETSGDVRIQKDAEDDSPYLTGRISIVRGSYDVYGRDFLLNSGDLLFTGPPDINPILNIQASYAGGGTVVFLDIRGTAQEPQPSLRSDPPLAENDIISVLIFGHPLNQINASGSTGESQSQAAQAIAGTVIGGYVSQSLREQGMNLGLDVVRVDPTNTGGNRLTVGRYIGPKLFVSYGQTLQNSAVRVFDANYYLSTHWSLVGETGASTDSFLDLLFRFPLNQPPSSRSTGFVTNTPFLPGPIQALPFPKPNPTAP